MEVFHSGGAQETEAFAQRMAGKLCPNDVIAFQGGLGMGKTTFVRGLAQGLGDASEVSSPTFAIVHEYRCKPTLYHFDMYRIDTIDDLYSTGFFDYLEVGAVLAIEWSERIAAVLPEHTITVAIAGVEGQPDARVITVEGDERF